MAVAKPQVETCISTDKTCKEGVRSNLICSVSVLIDINKASHPKSCQGERLGVHSGVDDCQAGGDGACQLVRQ